jgi:hypothetical protein
MRSHAALLVALTACSARAPRPVDNPPVVETPRDAAIAAHVARSIAPDAAPVTRKPFSVAWRKAGAGEGGFANAVAVRFDGSVAIAGDAHLANWTKKQRPKLRPGIVAMLDANGALRWAKEIQGSSVRSVVATSGGVIACGVFEKTLAIDGKVHAKSKGRQDLFVVELSPDGKVVWVFATGSASDDACNDLATMPDGKVAIVGSLGGETRFDVLTARVRGDGDAFVALLHPTGSPLWVTTAGSGAADVAHSVAILGGIFVTGSYGGDATFQTESLALPKGRGKVANPSNMFLAVYGGDGTIGAVTSFGVADSFDRGWSISALSTGVVVAGDVSGHAFVARYSNLRGQVWLREASGTARAVLALPKDDILLATFDNGETVVARYTADGELVDRAHFGNGGEHDVFDMATAANGRIALAGRLAGDSTITGELAASTQIVSNKDGQGIVVDVLDP